MLVLGIESSCDETAASVVGPAGVCSDVVYSQEVHARFGGVVPELAARAHVEKIGSVVAAALAEAGIVRADGVCATAGPGLIGAVLVGLSYAKSLAAAWEVPFTSVNHLEGHMLSPLLDDPAPAFPFLALVVSGGHTAIYHCRDLDDYETLGSTVDDAAGEAYDKVARMMRLGYPGGPVVDRLAGEGDPTAVRFPRPLPGELDFSFSGLKTAVRTHLQKPTRASDADVCASFQAAVVDCLIGRLEKASRQCGVRSVALSGGVAANSALRSRAVATGLDVFIPPRARCTDNGAMIANVGRRRLIRGLCDPLSAVARPGWSVAR